MTARTLTTSLIVPCVVLAGLGGRAAAADNPLLAPATLPYNAPPFDRIHDADYAPRDRGRHGRAPTRRSRASPATPAPADFDNTIVAMERSGVRLIRVAQIFENLTQSNTDPALDAAKDEIDPKLQAHDDAIHLNAKLFARIKAVHAAPPAGLDARSRFLLDETYKSFVHAGAALSPADQARLSALNQQITKLQTSFQQKLLAATSGGAVVVDDAKALAGLDQAAIQAAALAGPGARPRRQIRAAAAQHHAAAGSRQADGPRSARAHHAGQRAARATRPARTTCATSWRAWRNCARRRPS